MSSLSSLSPSLMYLLTKMLIWLALAGLIGLLIGWAIGKLSHQRRSRIVENDWRNTLLESGQAETQTFQKQVNEERAKNHKLQNLTKALKSASDEKDRRLQQLTTDLQHNKEQLRNLSSIESDDGYIALQKEVQELRSANLENAELRQRVATETREREDSSSELYRLRQQTETLEREREEFRLWSLKLEQEQAGFDDRVQMAVSEALRYQGTDANDLELEVARLRPMVDSLNQNVDRLKEENRQLQISHAAQSQPVLTTPSAQIQELQSELNEIGYERDQLRTRLADQERQTASLNTQLSGGNHYPADAADLRRQLAQVSAEKVFIVGLALISPFEILLWVQRWCHRDEIYIFRLILRPFTDMRLELETKRTPIPKKLYHLNFFGIGCSLRRLQSFIALLCLHHTSRHKG